MIASGGSAVGGAYMRGYDAGRDSVLGDEFVVERTPDKEFFGLPESTDEIVLRSVNAPISGRLPHELSYVAWQEVIRFNDSDYAAWHEAESRSTRRKMGIAILSLFLIFVVAAAVAATFHQYLLPAELATWKYIGIGFLAIAVITGIHFTAWKHADRHNKRCREEHRALLQKYGRHGLDPNSVGAVGSRRTYALLAKSSEGENGDDRDNHT